ncbi:serine--tRNA ligase [Mycoplasma miroungirhinis]|uniref:Serine--tRNA ligase n=1 Tax=Mycoplasma miroungirhinis TaxID=754516 RepID=A0A6M4JDK8_9MOLU|nr:serine--tRNA ligase [Mycoplasma miroungirhinis]QJR44328.1 serine--tRNA ligase [Mycoplasma miroungirhinis]
MLDLKSLLQDPNKAIRGLKNRNFDTNELLKLIDLVTKRNKKTFELEQNQALRNQLSEQIGIFKRNKQPVGDILKQVNEVKLLIEKENTELNSLNQQVEDIALRIPNIPYDDVPVGVDEDENVVINEYAKLGRGLVKNVKAHYEIAKDLDIVDFERSVKLAQSRFVLYKKEGAKLVRALANFMLDTHINNGYEELMPAHLVNAQMLMGTGQLPKFKEDLYKLENEDLWLIPTAEVPVTNYHNQEIIDLSKTKKFVAYTKCFRSEAGSGGKDTRGLIRQHEFHKVELVKLSNKENVLKDFYDTVEDAKNILKLLEIPFREVVLCTGDIGFSSAKTIDLELWIPSEQKYRETSSISVFFDFQARRSMIRYRDNENKVQYANTINGSGLAIDRVVAAILENYQNADGTISIPQALIPYFGKDLIK